MATKEQVRAYLTKRVAEHRPPPSLEEIRRQLGFGMVTPTVDPPRR